MIPAVTFNPVVSAVSAAVFAALWTRASGWTGRSFAVLTLLISWALADGSVAAVIAERAAAESGTLLGSLFGLTAAVALVVGYAAPAWAGAFVGARVTRGTGWRSAAVVSLTVSGAITAIVMRLG